MFRPTTGSFREIEGSLLSDLLTIRHEDPLSSLLVLIPNGRFRTHLQRQWTGRGADEGTRGFPNIHFLTFFGIAEQILADGLEREDYC